MIRPVVIPTGEDSERGNLLSGFSVCHSEARAQRAKRNLLSLRTIARAAFFGSSCRISRFVSGHGFSRAERTTTWMGLEPLGNKTSPREEITASPETDCSAALPQS